MSVAFEKHILFAIVTSLFGQPIEAMLVGAIGRRSDTALRAAIGHSNALLASMVGVTWLLADIVVSSSIRLAVEYRRWSCFARASFIRESVMLLKDAYRNKPSADLSTSPSA